LQIRTNIPSLNAHRNLKNAGLNQTRAAARLSSGYRINSAADDAAGLAISETMRAQIRGLDQAWRNTQDAIALIQTAEGAMSTVGGMVHRIRELMVLASNDTNILTNRQQVQLEIDQLVQEIDSISNRAEFNTRRLIDGSAAWESIAPTAAGLGMVMPFSASFVTPGGDVDLTAGMFISSDSFNVGNNILGNSDVNLVSIVGHITNGQRTTVAYVNVAAGEHISFQGSFGGLVGGPNVSTVVIITAPDGTVFDSRNFPAGVFLPDALAIDPRGVASLATSYANIPNNAAHPYLESGFEISFVNVSAAGTWRVEIYGHDSDLSHGAPGAIGVVVQRRLPHDPDYWRQFYRRPPEPPTGPLWFQTGANAGQGKWMGIAAMHSLALGIGDGNGNSRVNVVYPFGADISRQLGMLDEALNIVSKERSRLGAVQNRLEHTAHSLAISGENLSDAESRVRNADIAREMMRFTMSNVLQQAAMSMIAQANQLPEMMLQLVR